MRRVPFLLCVFVLAGCGNYLPMVGKYDGGEDAGAGVDAGQTAVTSDHSLFWNDAGILDDPQVISFAKVMGTISPDGHGGILLDKWFRRFASTAHSERALPAQFMDGVAVAQGGNPAAWDLSLLPFKVTGIHNRIDLADLSVGGHCGE